MISDITAGVIAGVIFSGLAYVVKEWLVPKYKAWMYKGVDISGKWNAFYEEAPEDPFAVIEFQQSDRDITGTAIVSKNRSKDSLDRKYNYKGTFLNHSIVLTFEDENNPLMMGGAMVFHYTDSDGKKMCGTTLYYTNELNAIKSSRLFLVKK